MTNQLQRGLAIVLLVGASSVAPAFAAVVERFIVLGKDGLPSEWSIDGTGQVGAKIGESYRRTPDGPAVHVPRDASPWSFALYVHALEHAPGQRMQIPDLGTLTLAKLRQIP